jgi:hypothetical protein
MPARLEVTPDAEGGWSVLRDRVLSGWWPGRRRAIAYAVERVRAAIAAGGSAELVVYGADGQLRLRRSFGTATSRSSAGVRKDLRRH